MPRLPYVFPVSGESAVADRIRERRQGTLLELDGMLLNAPNIANGYDSLLKAIRSETTIAGDLRELIILRVAALNGATYEWIAHEPIARNEGLSSSQLEIVRNVDNVPLVIADKSLPLSPLQAAALAYTDFMTKTIKVPQAVFDDLHVRLGDDRRMFEVTATIAAYNMVSRMLVALDVGDKATEDIPKIN